MSINIKTTNISKGTEAESYLMKKLDLLKRLIDFDADNVNAQVELAKTSSHHKSGDIFKAEINVRVGKASFRAVSEKEDIFQAIDDMKDELSEEIKHEKDKHQTNVRKGGAEIKNIVKSINSDDEA